MPLGYLVLLSNQEIVDITSPALASMEAAVGLHLCFVCWASKWKVYVSLPGEVAQPSGRESGERQQLGRWTLMHRSLASLSLTYCVL